MEVQNSYDKIIAYTDGSYYKRHRICSYGVILLDEHEIPFESFGDIVTDPGYVNMNNVGGEIFAVLKAMERAVKFGCKHLTIYHDYIGLSEWANDKWKTNNDYTESYKNTVLEYRQQLTIDFVKVKGHSGNQFNDMADGVANAVALDYIKKCKKLKSE